MPRESGSIISRCLMVGTIWLASVGTANAILHKGIIDPQFSMTATGLTGSELGWSAEILFELDGCPVSPGFAVTCSTMLLESATGTLYDKDDPNTPISIPALLDFLPTAPDPINSVVFGIDGEVLGINTDPIGFEVASAPTAYLLNGTANLWLQFFAPPPPISLFSAYTSTSVTHAPGGYLIVTNVCTTHYEHTYCPNPTSGTFSDTAEVTFTTVPEPGSLWLILGALSAGWLVRRRRSTH